MHVAWRAGLRVSSKAINLVVVTRKASIAASVLRLSSSWSRAIVNAAGLRLRRLSWSSTIAQTSQQFFTSSGECRMEPNGRIRHKRKASPVSLFDRPAKLFKSQISDRTENGDTSRDELYDMESDSEDQLPVAPTAGTADTAEWQATIEKVVRNVVSIHFCQTCSFDTDGAVSSEATGFVVDAQRGYILTNRHVVGAGPFWGYCIFDNHEEVRDGYGAEVDRLCC